MRVLATLSACLFSVIAAATPLHQIVIFGDSLSDNGNLYQFMNKQLPQSPPYYEGRFSNGPVWIESLASDYFPDNPSAHLQNYAFGGAGVSEDPDDDGLFTLRKELNSYFAAHEDRADEDSLYIVWIGSNNYLGIPDDTAKVLREVNTGIVHGLQQLVDKGAKHIMVINLPDLGRSPAALEFGSVDIMSYFTNQHNDTLKQTMSDLQQDYPGVEWVYFDMNSMFTEVLEHAENYGFTNITNTCVNNTSESANRSLLHMVASAAPSERTKDFCEGYLFFDLVHPTAKGHALIAERAKMVLDAAGVEFSSD